MLAALLADIRTPSYPIEQGRRKRPEWWLNQYPKELVAEKKAIARDLKRASERLRFMRITGEATERFEKLAEPYATKNGIDYLEMALDPYTRAEVNLLLQSADDEEFMLWF